ncbi:MAG: hypothetical protein U0794_20325 [Isosphaeraceae bacterium]
MSRQAESSGSTGPSVEAERGGAIRVSRQAVWSGSPFAAGSMPAGWEGDGTEGTDVKAGRPAFTTWSGNGRGIGMLVGDEPVVDATTPRWAGTFHPFQVVGV